MFSFYVKGTIYTAVPDLDREQKATYTIRVKARDGMGLHAEEFGIATVIIKLIDINDNFPTFKQSEFCKVKGLNLNTLYLYFCRFQLAYHLKMQCFVIAEGLNFWPVFFAIVSSDTVKVWIGKMQIPPVTFISSSSLKT